LLSSFDQSTKETSQKIILLSVLGVFVQQNKCLWEFPHLKEKAQNRNKKRG